MDQYKVYCHIFPNGKRYFGITMQDVNLRWRNGKGYKTQDLMYRAIKKYGWHNVTHVIVADGLSMKMAVDLEKALIDQYQTTEPEHGYNRSTGGEKPHVGVKLTDEQKAELSRRFSGEGNPMYGKHRPESVKKAISKAHKGKYCGENHPLFGKHRSEHTKELLRKANLGNYKGEDHPQTKKVEAYNPETGVTLFTCVSVSEAVRNYGARKVSECCRGKRKKSGGYHWRFAEC